MKKKNRNSIGLPIRLFDKPVKTILFDKTINIIKNIEKDELNIKKILPLDTEPIKNNKEFKEFVKSLRNGKK